MSWIKHNFLHCLHDYSQIKKVNEQVLRRLSSPTSLQPARNNATLTTLMQNSSNCSVNLLLDLRVPPELWPESKWDSWKTSPISYGPREAGSGVSSYSTVSLQYRQQCTRSCEKGEKGASFSADQYQRSWSRTGTGIDTLCGADLSHSPQVIPSSAGEVTGPATERAIRRWFQVLNNLHINQH